MAGTLGVGVIGCGNISSAYFRLSKLFRAIEVKACADLNMEIAQAQAMAAELAEARERLADTPSSMVVANHAMGLYELGAIHLSNNPPNLSEAKVAIDAMGAIVDALPGRLGEHEETLQAARSQIQMAFVELSTQADED